MARGGTYCSVWLCCVVLSRTRTANAYFYRYFLTLRAKTEFAPVGAVAQGRRETCRRHDSGGKECSHSGAVPSRTSQRLWRTVAGRFEGRNSVSSPHLHASREKCCSLRRFSTCTNQTCRYQYARHDQQVFFAPGPRNRCADCLLDLVLCRRFHFPAQGAQGSLRCPFVGALSPLSVARW